MESHTAEFDLVLKPPLHSKSLLPLLLMTKEVGFRRWEGNRSFVINWNDDGAKIEQHTRSSVRNALLLSTAHFLDLGDLGNPVMSVVFKRLSAGHGKQCHLHRYSRRIKHSSGSVGPNSVKESSPPS